MGVLGTVYKEMLAANPELAQEGGEDVINQLLDDEPAPDETETKK